MRKGRRAALALSVAFAVAAAGLDSAGAAPPDDVAVIGAAVEDPAEGVTRALIAAEISDKYDIPMDEARGRADDQALWSDIAAAMTDDELRSYAGRYVDHARGGT